MSSSAQMRSGLGRISAAVALFFAISLSAAMAMGVDGNGGGNGGGAGGGGGNAGGMGSGGNGNDGGVRDTIYPTVCAKGQTFDRRSKTCVKAELDLREHGIVRPA